MTQKLEIDESKLRQLVADDLQNHKIAEHFGCSESCIERRLKKLGIKKARTGPKSGDRHTGWKGGIAYLKGYRYIYSPDHPNCTKKKLVAEHRLVMEQKLGRYLGRKEVVHHLNGKILDNHPENLAVFGCNADHLRHELTGKCPNWTPEGRQRTLDGGRGPRSPETLARIRSRLKPYQELSHSGKEKRRALARKEGNLEALELYALLDTQPTDHQTS